MSPDRLAQMLQILVMGLCIVFASLIIIWAAIEIMHVIVAAAEKARTKKSKPEESAAPAETVQSDDAETDDEDEEELIAVLTAAVAASLNTSTYNLKIKSFRRIGQNSPAWNTVSRKEQLESNL